MKTNIKKTFVLALACALSNSIVAQDKQPLTVEFLNYWVSPAEHAATEVIGRAVQQKGAKWINSTSNDYLVMRRDAIERAVSGISPTGMLLLGGDDTIQLANIGLIHSLDNMAEQHNWTELFHDVALEAVQVNEQIFGLPITIHNESWLWFNADIYNALELEIPKSWQEFIDQADTIQANGYAPISVGNEDWLIHFVFRNIWASLGGIEAYRQLYHESDPAILQTQLLGDTLEFFAKLREFRGDTPPANWLDATQLIIEDKAAMMAMGDWAKGEFFRAGMVADEDFYCELFLTDQPFFIAGIDSLALPAIDTQLGPDQQLLIDTVSDAEIQIAFAENKGSIPAVRKLNTEALDSCNQKAYPLLLNDATRARISAEVTHEAHRSELQVALGQFWRDESISATDIGTRIIEIFNN